MNSDTFLTYEQLVADLEFWDRQWPSPSAGPLSLTEIVGRQGQVSLQGFFFHRQREELILPSPPNMKLLTVGSRATLLHRRDEDDIDLYPFSTMVVLGVTGELVDGYVFQSSALNNCRTTVIRSQIIECIPPLRRDEFEIKDLVFGEVPF